MIMICLTAQMRLLASAWPVLASSGLDMMGESEKSLDIGILLRCIADMQSYFEKTYPFYMGILYSGVQYNK